MAVPPKPGSIEFEVSEFIRLDDGIKRASRDMKEVRSAINKHKDHIIKYMVDSKIDRLSGATQCLECTKKVLKNRATSEQMVAKLSELLAAGITDPARLIKEVNECGGTTEEYRLFRKSKRVSAASLVAGALGASTGKKRKLKMVEKLAQ
jgi:tetraacyldisaccharide-1-P 4'-kinase